MRNLLFVMTVFAVGCGLGTDKTGDTTGASSVLPPVVKLKNPTCADLFGPDSIEYKVEPPQNGVFQIDPLNSVTISGCDGTYFDWSATLGIDAVIVKGGPMANVYTYSPEAMAGSGLHAAINANNGNPYGLSHISFCFDYEVLVTKTAETSFDRTYSWQVSKTADQTSLTLSATETFPVSYNVVVDAIGQVDDNFAVQGTIEVHNPAPFDATVTGVTDVVKGGANDVQVPVTCPVSFPHILKPGTTLTCSYSSSLPDGVNRVNEAAATTTGKVGEGFGTAPVDFASATINAIDECVSVEDDRKGTLGTVCAWDPLPKTFQYPLDIGPYGACGSYQYVNIVTITASDSGATSTAQASVDVTVPCNVGCTLTPGYWKTHSELGPAPYDDTWQALGGASQPFFNSGMSYHDVLWTPPKGNAYYILAHAYAAAELNSLAGADLTAVLAAFNQATTLLQAYTPDVVPLDKQLKADFVSVAGILDDYNNGITGPGHCDE